MCCVVKMKLVVIEKEIGGIIYYIKEEKVYDVEEIIRKGRSKCIGEYVNGELRIKEVKKVKAS